MGRLFRNFRLLLWKNFTLKWRNKKRTLLDLFVPLIIAVILLVLRQTVKSVDYSKNTVYPSFSIDHLPANLSAPKLSKWQLGYDHMDAKAVKTVMTMIGQKLNIVVKGFKSEQQFIDQEIKLKSKNSTFLGLISFNDVSINGNGSFTKNITYKIRLSPTSRNYNKSKPGAAKSAAQKKWLTEDQFPAFQVPEPRTKDMIWGGPPGYMAEGFLTLQHSLSAAIITHLSGTNDTLPNIEMQRFPYPPYLKDNFLDAIKPIFPFALLFSFIFTFLTLVKNLVYEREKRIKESMKVMGLSNWLHWLASFTEQFALLLVCTAILAILFSQVLEYSSGVILFIFLIIYVINVIMFSFLLSVFFSKANSATTAAGLAFFIAYLPYPLVQARYDTLSWSSKMLLSLFGNTAMSFGAQIITMWEGTGSGVQFSNIAHPVSPDDNLTILHILLMLMLDSFLYGVFAWYVEAVKPGEFGIAQPFYFPFLPSYWRGTQGNVMVDYNETENQRTEFIEIDPIGLKTGISIRGLTKVYKPNLTAVNDLHLNMFQGQITALLGHNGAGKTTTMAMLTGIYPPTAGTAFVEGYDIRSEISRVRESLGYCPQHDVLFDQLTVEEHLRFYCTLKGLSNDKMKGEIDRMIQTMNLEDKRNEFSMYLSGGMKRKLSVGIALCAESKVVMLDEPTSGMDPSARRATWDLLNSEKSKRTILLSTHYMEEADVLGDRIAILAGGKLQCCGSSMFLKRKYGAGYHMVLVKDSSCIVKDVSKIVFHHVPNAALESDMGAELSYTLPHESSSNFQALFQDIEDKKTDIGITGYGASVTTMEEVFIKVGENYELEEESNTSGFAVSKRYNSFDETVNVPSNPVFSELKRLSGWKLIQQHVRALLVKRIMYTLRNKILTFSQLAIPILMVTMALAILKFTPKVGDSPALNLNLDHFKGTEVPIAIIDNSNPEALKLLRLYQKQFAGTDNKIVNVTASSETKYINELAKAGKNDISKYSLHWIIGATFIANSSGSLDIKAFFNNQPYHSPPISLLAIQNALIKSYVGEDYSFSVINDPLPRTADIKALQESEQQLVNAQLGQNLMYGMSFLAASFIVFLVKERVCKAKLLQVVSGVHLLTFWSTTFIWDIINYMIPSLICVSLFLAFHTDGFKEPVVQGVLILLLFIHGIAVLPLVYCISFGFKVPSSAYGITALLMAFLGTASVIVITVLQFTNKDLVNVLDWVLSVLPMYCLSRSISQIDVNYSSRKLCDQLFSGVRKIWPGPNTPSRNEICNFAKSSGQEFPCCPDTCSDSSAFCIKYTNNYLAWDEPGIGRYLVFLIMEGIISIIILVLIEKHILRRIKYSFVSRKNIQPRMHCDDSSIPKDNDVEKERERISTTPLSDLVNTDMLIFKNLSKHYKHVVAVDDLSLGIYRGECFGLLGMNGAGKTSTFKMITGDEEISKGDAYLDTFSVKNQLVEVQKRLGYCPQFDALIDELTGEETIRLFARLRGVPECDINDVIKNLSDDLILRSHIKKLSGNYSGGNKRKLSTAIALVGDPPVVFLDEPTSGVDPMARQFMWKAICQVKESGRCVLLTSHSMEECEALCGRLVIMVNGQFCCLGSPQHLKSKFGSGYTVLAKISTENVNRTESDPSDMGMSNIDSAMQPQNLINAFQTFFTTKFPQAKLISIHQSFIHYHIPIDSSVGWASIFGTMEDAKKEYHLEDYTVSQTSLEQIFLQFAKLQRGVEN